MLFKELKPGQLVYVIEPTDQFKAYSSKVLEVSSPYFDAQQSNVSLQRVVDVTLECNGTKEVYKIPETLSTTKAGSKIMFSNRDAFLAELESMKLQSKELLDHIDYHRELINSIDKAIADYDPQFRDKKETDQRLDRMEHNINELSSLVKQFLTRS